MAEIIFIIWTKFKIDNIYTTKNYVLTKKNKKIVHFYICEGSVKNIFISITIKEILKVYNHFACEVHKK